MLLLTDALSSAAGKGAIIFTELIDTDLHGLVFTCAVYNALSLGFGVGLGVGGKLDAHVVRLVE